MGWMPFLDTFQTFAEPDLAKQAHIQRVAVGSASGWPGQSCWVPWPLFFTPPSCEDPDCFSFLLKMLPLHSLESFCLQLSVRAIGISALPSIIVPEKNKKENHRYYHFSTVGWHLRSWNPRTRGLTHFSPGLKGSLHLRNHLEKGVPFSEALPAWTPQAECQRACQLDKARANTVGTGGTSPHEQPLAPDYVQRGWADPAGTLSSIIRMSHGGQFSKRQHAASSRNSAMRTVTQTWTQDLRSSEKGGCTSRVSADTRTHLSGRPRQCLFNVEWQFDRIDAVGDGWRQKHPSLTRATSRFLVSGTTMVLQAPQPQAELADTTAATFRSKTVTVPGGQDTEGGDESTDPMTRFWADSWAHESALGSMGQPGLSAHKQVGSGSQWKGLQVHRHMLVLCWFFDPKLCLTLVTPRTVAHQAPLSMKFSGKEYWSG